MFVNIDDIENNSELDVDLCIIGGGAAGITIAREFINSNLKVCLVESGDTFLEEDVQALYDTKNIGVPYPKVDALRLRFFGGTTNHWEGNCRPLDDLDFEKRSWVPHSGWPITKKTLDPYYVRAQSVCELGQYIYDDRLLEGLDVSTFPLLTEKLVNNFWQCSPPTRFGVSYKSELEKASNIKILLNANLTDLKLNPRTNFVQFAQTKSLNGKNVRIKSKDFVLACGGIENPRLLLNFNQVAPKGLGNGNDLVGRFFMDHPDTHCAIAVPKNSIEDYRIYERGQNLRMSSPILRSEARDVEFFSSFCLSQKLQEKENLLGGLVYLMANWVPESGVKVLKGLLRDFKVKRMPDDLTGKIWTVMQDWDEIATLIYQKYISKGKRTMPPVLRLHVVAEQAPNPDSRITLSEQTDALGLKKTRLDWRLGEIEKRTVQSMVKTLGMELGRLNLARVKMDEWLMDEKTDYWPPNMTGEGHHTGTTRMSDDPKKGVVDKDCRVHEVNNLFIAGSSVFPTCGYTMPTLTIVALALRLADHLKNNLMA